MRREVRSRRLRWIAALALCVAGLFFLSAPGWPPFETPLPARAAPPGAPGPVPGRLVLDLRDDLSLDAAQRLAARYGIRLRSNSPHALAERLYVAETAPDSEPGLLARLRRERAVEAADRLHRYRIAWTPNDPRYPEQWNLRMVDAERAWERTAGEGIVVAVIDTGVAFEADDRCYHARDFRGTRFVRGYDFVNDDAHPNDDHGHGTHVAGTVAETTDNGEGAAGLAFRARIMPIKVLDRFGIGDAADIADAIRFAVRRGARVLNLSLGGPEPNDAIRAACREAARMGALIVCAAGNTGGGPVSYPAAFPECLAVAAVGPAGERAPYSAVGPEIALAAPGGDTRRGQAPQDGILQNTVRYGADGRLEADGYFFFNGTSMAAPHVAAAAAMAMAMGIREPARVRRLLERSATRRPPEAGCGAGVLNVGRMVELAASSERDGRRLLAGAVLTGALGLGGALFRAAEEGAFRWPWGWLALAFGLLGLPLEWAGAGGSPPLLLLAHSALLPLALLAVAERRSARRLVAALALGVAARLAWTALRLDPPFATPSGFGLAWLWANALLALGAALVACRGTRAEPSA